MNVILFFLLLFFEPCSMGNASGDGQVEYFAPPFGSKDGNKSVNFVSNSYQTPCEVYKTQNQHKPRIMHGGYLPPHFSIKSFVHLEIMEQNGQLKRCSGSLIHPSLVLSSAHCIDNANLGGWMVYSGMKDHQELKSGNLRKVAAFVAHPSYVDLGIDSTYDLAVIRLEIPFDLSNENIGTIELPLGSELKTPIQSSTPAPDLLYPLNTWTDCQLAGSVRTFESYGTRCVRSPAKRYMGGVLIPHDCCAYFDSLGRPGPMQTFPLGTFCIFNSSDSGCSGDSGSGVICLSSKSKTPTLIGVLRANARCCDAEDREINDPLPRNIIPMDLERRAWVRNVAEFFKKYGTLLGEFQLPSQTAKHMKDDDFM